MIGGIAAALALGAVGWFAYTALVRRGILRYNRWDRRVRGTLRPGQPAPDVAVEGWDGAPVRLSTLWRERPVVLVFGSCT